MDKTNPEFLDEAIAEAMKALYKFEASDDRSGFREWLDKYDKEVTMRYIKAFDTIGNEFTKEIQIKEGFNQKEDEYGHYGKIVSFGWPCEYYINSLLRNYPFDKDLCIDMSGLNHKGHQVFICRDDINELLKHLKENQDG